MDEIDRAVEQHVAVYDYLRERGNRWTTAKTIDEFTGVSPSQMRALCQDLPAEYVSSNSGYKLVRNATRAEVLNCVQHLLSRADKITTRAAALAGRLA